MSKEPMLVTLVAQETERFVQEYEARVDEDGVQVNSAMDNKGRELPDPTPLAPPVGFMQTPDLKDIIRDMLRHDQMKRAADEAGVDSFDESEDFDIEDDPLDPQTEYEAEFDPEWLKVKEGYSARLKGPEAWKEFCLKNGLTEDGKTFIRPKSPHVKGDDDGRASEVDEGRVDVGERRNRRSDSVGKGKSGAKSADDDRGSVQEAGRSSRTAQDED